MLTRTKSLLSNFRMSGAAITQKAVIAVGNGVLIARCPGKMTASSDVIAY